MPGCGGTWPPTPPAGRARGDGSGCSGQSGGSRQPQGPRWRRWRWRRLGVGSPSASAAPTPEGISGGVPRGSGSNMRRWSAAHPRRWRVALAQGHDASTAGAHRPVGRGAGNYATKLCHEPDGYLYVFVHREGVLLFFYAGPLERLRGHGEVTQLAAARHTWWPHDRRVE